MDGHEFEIIAALVATLAGIVGWLMRRLHVRTDDHSVRMRKVEEVQVTRNDFRKHEEMVRDLVERIEERRASEREEAIQFRAESKIATSSITTALTAMKEDVGHMTKTFHSLLSEASTRNGGQ